MDVLMNELFVILQYNCVYIKLIWIEEFTWMCTYRIEMNCINYIVYCIKLYKIYELILNLHGNKLHGNGLNIYDWIISWMEYLVLNYMLGTGDWYI